MESGEKVEREAEIFSKSFTLSSKWSHHIGRNIVIVEKEVIKKNKKS